MYRVYFNTLRTPNACLLNEAHAKITTINPVFQQISTGLDEVSEDAIQMTGHGDTILAALPIFAMLPSLEI